jgi:hypothetical protein
VGLVDELSAAAPAVIVLDDLQWADDASLIVWHQLAASIGQLRLLLIGTCRPAPRRPEVQELRAAVIRHGGAVVTLGPLAETDVTALVTAMLGSPPGDTLRQLTAQAAGNPLYVRELVDAMVRERARLRASQWGALYVFDEPSTGLHPLDVATLTGVFGRLLRAGATIIVIDHDLDLLAVADHLIDMGPGGGPDGGRIVAAGTPGDVARAPASVTAPWLADHLGVAGSKTAENR